MVEGRKNEVRKDVTSGVCTLELSVAGGSCLLNLELKNQIFSIRLDLGALGN